MRRRVPTYREKSGMLGSVTTVRPPLTPASRGARNLEVIARPRAVVSRCRVPTSAGFRRDPSEAGAAVPCALPIAHAGHSAHAQALVHGAEGLAGVCAPLVADGKGVLLILLLIVALRKVKDINEASLHELNHPPPAAPSAGADNGEAKQLVSADSTWAWRTSRPERSSAGAAAGEGAAGLTAPATARLPAGLCRPAGVGGVVAGRPGGRRDRRAARPFRSPPVDPSGPQDRPRPQRLRRPPGPRRFPSHPPVSPARPHARPPARTHARTHARAHADPAAPAPGRAPVPPPPGARAASCTTFSTGPTGRWPCCRESRTS